MVAEINVASSRPFTETHHLSDASDVVSIRIFTLVTVSDSIQPTVTNFLFDSQFDRIQGQYLEKEFCMTRLD